jgi:integrase
VRLTDGKDQTHRLAIADDFGEADGRSILTYWQAQDAARAKAKAYAGDIEPVTVAKALDEYEGDLATRGGAAANVQRVRIHLSKEMLALTVVSLKQKDWRRWRDALAKKVGPASVNRICSSLKAALNLAADQDERITHRPWKTGLQALRDAERSRNVILSDRTVRLVVEGAYQYSRELGVLVEVAAVTGARVSQLARLEVQDVQGDRPDPRLLMPSSKKGRGVKAISRRAVPMPASLALRLKELGANRPANAPLLLRRYGRDGKLMAWKPSSHAIPFGEVIDALRERIKSEERHNKPMMEQRLTEIADATIYALRHSNIVRQLLANVPIRVVAVNHDTSVAMIEWTYSRYVADHADALARQALIEIAAPFQRGAKK